MLTRADTYMIQNAFNGVLDDAISLAGTVTAVLLVVLGLVVIVNLIKRFGSKF